MPSGFQMVGVWAGKHGTSESYVFSLSRFNESQVLAGRCRAAVGWLTDGRGPGQEYCTRRPQMKFGNVHLMAEAGAGSTDHLHDGLCCVTYNISRDSDGTSKVRNTQKVCDTPPHVSRHTSTSSSKIICAPV